MIYKKSVSEPWFSLIKLKLKTYEGRLNKGDFAKLKLDDIIIFENNDFGINRKVKTKIIKMDKYNSFKNFLESKKITNCLPGIDNISDGIKIYYNYYSKENENQYGVLAIKLTVID
jgi:ASC-1-like (ASCH) protein